jgi:hypothetical protein
VRVRINHWNDPRDILLIAFIFLPIYFNQLLLLSNGTDQKVQGAGSDEG